MLSFKLDKLEFFFRFTETEELHSKVVYTDGPRLGTRSKKSKL